MSASTEYVRRHYYFNVLSEGMLKYGKVLSKSRIQATIIFTSLCSSSKMLCKHQY